MDKKNGNFKDRVVNELSKEFERCELETTIQTREIAEKEKELKLVKIKAVAIKIRIERIKKLETILLRDCVGRNITIGDSIQIVNEYTKFSKKKWTCAIRTKARVRAQKEEIEDFHKDRFDNMILREDKTSRA